MKSDKFILEILSTGDTIQFKTMREISNYLNISYHAARGLYIYNTQGKKHLHTITKMLATKYKIIDNSEYLNF